MSPTPSGYPMLVRVLDNHVASQFVTNCLAKLHLFQDMLCGLWALSGITMQRFSSATLPTCSITSFEIGGHAEQERQTRVFRQFVRVVGPRLYGPRKHLLAMVSIAAKDQVQTDPPYERPVSMMRSGFVS